MSDPAELIVRDVSAGYRDREVLHQVSCRARSGEILGMIGPNGAGKTTLLRVMNGALRPWKGDVQVSGMSIQSLRPRDRSRLMASVSQSLYVPVPFTVSELVGIGRTPYVSGWSPFTAADRAAVDRALEKADLADMQDAPLDELSAGERQRALVAMALAQEPRVLLLDEPTAHLDIQHAWRLMELVAALARNEKLTVVISTHDLNLAGAFCSTLLLLDRGHVALQGSPGQVLTAEAVSRVYSHPLEVLQQDDQIWVRPKR